MGEADEHKTAEHIRVNFIIQIIARDNLVVAGCW